MKLFRKAKFCFCHWCKKSYMSRVWMWKHEDSCIDNPEVVKKIRNLNGFGVVI